MIEGLPAHEALRHLTNALVSALAAAARSPEAARDLTWRTAGALARMAPDAARLHELQRSETDGPA